MALLKFYALYSNDDVRKLLTTASTDDILKSETEFYSDGTWFEYEHNEDSNLLINEKKMKGIKFPPEPKNRDYTEFGVPKKVEFKWVS